MVNTFAFNNNILDRLLHIISNITAKIAANGSSLSKNRYC